MTKKEVIYYKSDDEKEPFSEWLESIKDEKTKTRIKLRLTTRISLGNYGDCKSVGDGVLELRYHFGAGYRVYFGEDDDTIVVILIGGDKNTKKGQSKDIKTAKEYWQDYLDAKEDTE